MRSTRTSCCATWACRDSTASIAPCCHARSLTSAGGAEDEARALAAGYDSVLVRPLEAESLAKLLRLYANLPSAIQ